MTPIQKLSSITGHRYGVNDGDDGDDDDDSGDGGDDGDDGAQNIVVLPVQRLVVELHSLATVVVNFALETEIEVEQRHIAH